MLNKRNNIIYSIILIIIVCILGFFIIAHQHEIKADRQIDLGFMSQGENLAGTLLLPPGKGPFPVVIFIHGDGAQTRGLENYALIMNTFLKSGIACYSWDKAGVGQSGGNWLNQTMTDRAKEGLIAMQKLSERNDIQANGIGFIGFSQGGWVISEIAQLSTQPAFFITIGATLDWKEQNEYFTRVRLSRSGFTGSAIDRVISWQSKAPQPSLRLKYIDYVATFQSYLSNTSIPDGANISILSSDRYHFIAKNIDANSSIGLASVKVPFLAIWGANDWNVDALGNARVYAGILGVKNNHQTVIKIFPDADHKILRSSTYGSQLPSEWTWNMSVQYFFEIESAFAPGYLGLLSEWTQEQLK